MCVGKFLPDAQRAARYIRAAVGGGGEERI